MSAHPVVNYDPVEERINFISHAIGAGLALIAGILLIIKGSYLETAQWIGLMGLCFEPIFISSQHQACIILRNLQSVAVGIKN